MRGPSGVLRGVCQVSPSKEVVAGVEVFNSLSDADAVSRVCHCLYDCVTGSMIVSLAL